MSIIHENELYHNKRTRLIQLRKSITNESNQVPGNQIFEPAVRLRHELVHRHHQCARARSPLCPGVSCKSNTHVAPNIYTNMLAYTGKARLTTRRTPPTRGAIIPPIRERAVAIPHAVPRTPVEKISGVHPYSMAYVAVEHKLIPSELTRIKSGPLTWTNRKQQKAVRIVIPASDPFRPSELSTKYAPRIAPGHPPKVKMTTSHRLSCKDLGIPSPNDPVSRSFGKKTLNIV